MKYSQHTMLVSDLATEFAVGMGFTQEDLRTPRSDQMWTNWTALNCQPNFRENVTPDPTLNCGPYSPLMTAAASHSSSVSDAGDINNHDTIGMVAIDKNGNIAAGTSTNGLSYKISGRVGDSPITGAGAFADNDVGAAVATGNGDIMMRFLPSFLAVELMRSGYDPTTAASMAVAEIPDICWSRHSRQH